MDICYQKAKLLLVLQLPLDAACVMLINQGYDVKQFILDIRNDWEIKKAQEDVAFLGLLNLF